jgi:hypothetical protein
MAKLFARVVRTRSGYPQWHNIKREVERTIDSKVKPEVLSYFTRITDLWEHEVGFQARKRVTAEFIRLYVYPTGPNKKIWIFVSGGTRGPYPIPKQPRPRGYPLRFRTGYKPKTGRGYRYRGPGKATGPWRSAHQVMHPGIKAREFEKHIIRFYKPKFRRHIENAMRRGMRRL